MNAHVPLPCDTSTEPAADPAAWGEGVLLRQSAMLEQLAEAVLRMALAIERSVTEAPALGQEPVAVTEAAMAFTRVSRAMRMTALLQSRLVKEWQALAESPERQAALAEAAKTAQRNTPANLHKVRVENVVARVAKAACGEDEERIDRLMTEAGERLDDDGLYGDVLSRPIGELVALICRDLGLDPDWTRLAEEAWAQAEAEGGDPRSPFALMDPTRPPPFTGEVPQRGGGGIPPPPPSNSAIFTDSA